MLITFDHVRIDAHLIARAFPVPEVGWACALQRDLIGNMGYEYLLLSILVGMLSTLNVIIRVAFTFQLLSAANIALLEGWLGRKACTSHNVVG